MKQVQDDICLHTFHQQSPLLTECYGIQFKELGFGGDSFFL